MKKRLLLTAGLLALLILAAAIERLSRPPQPVSLIPTLSGQSEYCLTCHAGLPEISAAHPVETFGCVLCHGGERLALDADLAHSTLRGGSNPSDLAVVEASCGGALCHSGETLANRDHIQRVQASLHSTYAGAIAAARQQTGLQSDLSARQAIQSVTAISAGRAPLAGELALPHTLETFVVEPSTAGALAAFAANCLGCHLRSESEEAGQYSGCAACHSPASPNSDQPNHTLTTAIPSSQCLRCHNLGSFDLQTMQFTAVSQPSANPHPTFSGYTKCTASLDCIDCHTRLEVMGDGYLLNSMHDVRAVACFDCHGTLAAPPAVQQVVSPEDLSLRLAFLNPSLDLAPGEWVARTAHAEPLWNVRRLEDGHFTLLRKLSGQAVAVPLVQGSGCTQDPERQAAQDCFICHRQPGVIDP